MTIPRNCTKEYRYGLLIYKLKGGNSTTNTYNPSEKSNYELTWCAWQTKTKAKNTYLYDLLHDGRDTVIMKTFKIMIIIPSLRLVRTLHNNVPERWSMDFLHTDRVLFPMGVIYFHTCILSYFMGFSAANPSTLSGIILTDLMYIVWKCCISWSLLSSLLLCWPYLTFLNWTKVSYVSNPYFKSIWTAEEDLCKSKGYLDDIWGLKML